MLLVTWFQTEVRVWKEAGVSPWTCNESLQGFLSNMFPISETCTCGRISSPVANTLSGFNQINFCHDMRTKLPKLKVLFFFFF